MRTSLLSSIVLLSGMLSAPLAGQAQPAAGAPPARRYYLGLGGAVGYYAQSPAYASSILAPTFTAGWRPTPRLALELGVLVYHTRDEYGGQGMYIDTTQRGSTPKGAIFRSVYQQRTQAVSLAGRYTLTGQASSRLHLDAVAGLALVHTDAYGDNATLDQATGQLVQGSAYTRYDRTTGCLLLGPSLRYQAGSRLELVGEAIGNFAPGGQDARRGQVALTLGLSARYCFGAATLP